MEKKKTKVATSDNPVTAQAVPKLSTVPEEAEDKVAPRSVSSSVSSDNQASTIARATERLEDTEEPAATIDRARMIKSVQRSVGNTRVGQVLAAGSTANTSTPMIQCEKKEQAPKKPPPISTPLPKEATRKPTGEAEFAVGTVNVTALPDKKSNKPIIVKGKKRDAITNVRLNWELPGAKTAGDTVIAVTAVPPPKLSIQTTYGPGATSEMKSNYGKGTTREDIKAGNTTLGYHEGSHGEYAIQYLRDNPLPVFEGKVEMTIAEYQAAQTEYDRAMEQYRKALDTYHFIKTDCVGQKGEGCEE
jgi:hypothetical protein